MIAHSPPVLLPIWALIALGSGNYGMPANTSAATQATRQMYINEILTRQLPDGGWALSGSLSDPDMTGMALQALAKYTSDSRVTAAVDKALTYLSAIQNQDGGYTYGGADNCESVVQAWISC